MKQEYQDEFKKDLEKIYLRNAFETLGLYAYWGKRFKEVDDQVKDYSTRIEKAEDKIKELMDVRPTNPEIRAQIKVQKKDVETYGGLLDGVKKLHEALHKKCGKLQQEAVEYLQQAKEMAGQSFNTPEEIEAQKAKVVVADKDNHDPILVPKGGQIVDETGKILFQN